MAMHMKLQMKMTQQLIMTPQLQQAIKLLQLSRAELEELIEQSLVENPVLEESMDIDTYPSEEQRDMTTEQTEVPVSEETYETAREEEKEEKQAPGARRYIRGAREGGLRVDPGSRRKDLAWQAADHRGKPHKDALIIHD